MASGWRGFGFGVEYFEQFAGPTGLGEEGFEQGLDRGGDWDWDWEPIWVMGESWPAKGFSRIRVKAGGAWRLVGGAMGNWPPGEAESRLASLLVVLMGAAGAVRVRWLLGLLGLLLLRAVCAFVSVSVSVSVPVSVWDCWSPGPDGVAVSVSVRAPAARVNSPMCGGSRSSAGRRISVIPEA